MSHLGLCCDGASDTQWFEEQPLGVDAVLRPLHHFDHGDVRAACLEWEREKEKCEVKQAE
jgi:hypothetical protein